MIKAITFDLDGVYFPESGKKGFHNRLTKLVKDESKVIHALYKSPQMLQLVTNELTENDFVDWLNEFLGTSFTIASLSSFWIKDYVIDENVKMYIRKAKDAGYVTCTCSNNNRIRVNALQNRFGFLADFDVKIFSYEYGAVKPDKKIFKALIDEANVKANELVYSDDNPDRIQGAIDMGINTFVFEDFEKFKIELKNLDVVIK